MRKYMNTEVSKKGVLGWTWENQHPLMQIGFVVSSISLFSVYVFVFTQL